MAEPEKVPWGRKRAKKIMNLHKRAVLSVFFLLFALWGCEEKASPVEDTPSEIPEELPKHGYIDTH